MSRFVRDEKKTYPFLWLIIGGAFAFSTFWASYAEFVTGHRWSRVKWQEAQGAFFELEYNEAKAHFDREEQAWAEVSATEPLKTTLARLAELNAQMADGGEYAEAKAVVAQLDKDFLNEETAKTFGASDLDEAYYYRNLAEYARDAAQVNVRKAYKLAYPEDLRASENPAAIYLDPSKPNRDAGETIKGHHLRSEVLRNQTHVVTAQEQKAASAAHPAVISAINESIAKIETVIGILKREQTHRARIDVAEAVMAAISGPADPIVGEKDPKKVAAAKFAARTKACQAFEPKDNVNCVRWLKLGPIDTEHKQATIAESKAKRSLTDATLRLEKAKQKADPSFDIGNPMMSLVGPFQIEQIVLNWMAYDRDVDIQQVDRCHTCHMGTNTPLYTAWNIESPFRTHPQRDILMKSHPIEEFGCTTCHQGQGRATDDLAHSKWVLEVNHGHELWHYEGDHYWEDPMLPVGQTSKIIIDELNDTLEVKLGRGKKTAVVLEHIFPTKTVDQDEFSETTFFETLQTKLQAVVDADEKLKPWYRAVARKLDNRAIVGFVKIEHSAEELKTLGPPPKQPKLAITFPKADMAKLLGFGKTRKLASRTQTHFTAPAPMHQPVRAESHAAQGMVIDELDGDYKFVPPRGDAGLQVPDEMRNRMIAALPEIEAGCTRCHQKDVDLVPWRSHFEHVDRKLNFQEAEAAYNADAVAYEAAHGTTDLPKLSAAGGELPSLAPTLDEGRRLFRQFNCTGCHILEGYDNNRDQGPQLDDISAKVSPEWLLTWLRNPRGWRAKTSMPNLWPRPLDPASKLPYPEGTPEYEKWLRERSEETVAVAAYLYERSENPASRPGGIGGDKPLRSTIAGYANVEGANAEDGEKLFKAYGCQGCHATTEGGKDLPAAWRGRERDIAPTLSNLKNKLEADWIAYWVEDPSRYWHGTAMPQLRLTRQEAASVALFLSKTETQPNHPAEVTAAEVALVADAKQRNQDKFCTALGRKASVVDCGAKLIEQRGCFGCHQIDGFEGFAQVGPELTGFAYKDITKLDYGYAISDHHMQTTETFAAMKLDSPRIFARDRIALKMGDFDMSAAEIRALTLFLKSVVPQTPAEKYNPQEREHHASATRGRELVNDLNCRACHVIEGRGADIDGWRLAILTQDPQRRAPFLDGEGARVQPEWLFTFLRDPKGNGIRPWLHPDWAYGDDVPDDKRALRMPSFNLAAEQWTDIVRYFATWDSQQYPFQVPKVKQLDKQEKLWAVKNINSKDTGNCLSCHYFDEFPVERARGDLKKMAPDMAMIKRRLRPEWVRHWLLRPQSYLPYTSMTAFFASVDRDKDDPNFPKENDPFLSPPPKGWQGAVSDMRTLTTEEHVEILRDFLYSIPDDATWPKPGQEANSVLVDPEAARLVGSAPDGAEAGADTPADTPADPDAAAVPGG